MLSGVAAGPRPQPLDTLSPWAPCSVSECPWAMAARTPRILRSRKLISARCRADLSACRSILRGNRAYRLALQTREQHIRRGSAECARAFQRRLVSAASSVVSRKSHWHVVSLVWRQHRFAEGKLNSNTMFERLRRHFRAALKAAAIRLAIGGFDISMNEHEDGKFVDRRVVYTFPRQFRTPRHGRSYLPLERALDRLWRAIQARSRR